jgi:hypothetical protein
MKFSELWAAMILKNAKLLERTAKVTITVEQFHKALRQSYDAGQVDARKEVSGERKAKDIFDIFGR